MHFRNDFMSEGIKLNISSGLLSSLHSIKEALAGDPFRDSFRRASKRSFQRSKEGVAKTGVKRGLKKAHKP